MYVIVLSFKDYALYRLFTIIISKRGAPDGASGGRLIKMPQPLVFPTPFGPNLVFSQSPDFFEIPVSPRFPDLR